MDNDGFTSAISTSGFSNNNIAPAFKGLPIENEANTNTPIDSDDQFQRAIPFQGSNIPQTPSNEQFSSGTFRAPSFKAAPKQAFNNEHPINQNTQNPQSFVSPQFGTRSIQNQPIEEENSTQRAPGISSPKNPGNQKATGPVKLLILIIVLMFIGIIYFFISNVFFTQHKEIGIITFSKDIDAFSGSAIIVRDEKVIYEKDVANINFIANEGTQISKSSHVCTIYTNGLSKKEVNSLQQTRGEISNQQQSLIKALPVKDTRLSAIDDNLKKLVETTQNLILGAPGNMLTHEQRLKDAVLQRQSYIKSKFTDDTKLQRLYDTEINQLQKLETWAKQLIADENGIVSFYTDGFETSLTPSTILSKSTASLNEIIKGRASAPTVKAIPVYRIVQPNKWYVVLHINSRDWTPNKDEEYQLTIESFDNTTVKATVTKIARNGSELYVWLEVNDSVAPILYTRNCQVHISKKKDSFSVPKNAVITNGDKNYIVLSFREGDYSLEIDILKHDGNEVHFTPRDNISLLEGMKVIVFN